MNDNQRKRILQNMDSLVRQTDFEKLSKACLQYDLLTQVMLSNVYHAEPENMSSDHWNENTIKTFRHQRLFVKITKRGPKAFEKLLNIFQWLNYKDALNTLNGIDECISISRSKETGKPTTDRDDNINAGNFANNNIDINDGVVRQFSRSQSIDDGAITLHKCEKLIPPKKKVTVKKTKVIMKHNSIDVYPMDSKTNRGIFFMLNNVNFPSDETRHGSTEDANSLLALFQQLGFHLYSFTNLSQTNFIKRLTKLLALDEVKDTQCFVLALMTHGHLSGGVQQITFSDGSVKNVEEIEKLFYHNNCPNLKGKPKIFIYPYCRGDKPDSGVLIQSNKIQTDGVRYDNRVTKISQFSDVIKCYATTEGFAAHRDMEDGAWYIQCFVNILAEYAWNTSFEEMLKLIQSKVENMRTEKGDLQTPGYVNTGFNKILYFNPGI